MSVCPYPGGAVVTSTFRPDWNFTFGRINDRRASGQSSYAEGRKLLSFSFLRSPDFMQSDGNQMLLDPRLQQPTHYKITIQMHTRRFNVPKRRWDTQQVEFSQGRVGFSPSLKMPGIIKLIWQCSRAERKWPSGFWTYLNQTLWYYTLDLCKLSCSLICIQNI